MCCTRHFGASGSNASAKTCIRVWHSALQVTNRPRQPLLDVNAWLPPQALCGGNVCKSDFRLTGKIWFVNWFEAGPQKALDQLIDFVYRVIHSGTDVKYPSISAIIFENHNMQVVYIIDVDKISALFSCSIDERALSLEHPDDKRTHDGRNDPSPILCRPIDIKIANHGDVHFVESPVAFAECRAAVFAGGINPDRLDSLFGRGKLMDTLVLGGSVGVNEFAHL